jgi:hypothetical protein
MSWEVAGVILSGIDTALIVGIIFRAGAWYGQVNARLDAQDRDHAAVAARLASLESVLLSRRGRK